MTTIDLVLSLLLLSAIVIVTDGLKCVKTGPCSCRTANGTIDLSPLAAHGTARFKDVPDTQFAASYSWNPCTSFSEGDNCHNVAACQTVLGLNTTKNIGTQSTAQFVTTSTGDFTLQYTHPDPSGVNRTTVVTLFCDHNEEAAIGVFGEETAFIYSMALTSKYACVRP